MAMNQFGVGLIFKGVDAVSPVAKRIGASLLGMRKNADQSMTAMNKTMTSAVLGFKAMKIGFGMAGFAKDMADAAGPFEQGLVAIGVISGATATELNSLHDAAIDASLATQFSPDEAVEGLRNMAAMGLDATDAMNTLIPVLDLAAGSLGQLGLAESANAVVGTMKAFGMETKNATAVTDKLLKITQLTNFQARDFSVGLSRAAVSADAFGQSLDDALIQMGLLRNLNIDASVASTSLREAWRRIGSDEKAQQLIRSKGIVLFDKHTKKQRAMMDIMTELSRKMEKMDGQEQQRIKTQIFGTRGMAAFNAVYKAQTSAMIDGIKVTLKGADAVDFLRKKMKDSAGAAKEMKDKMLDTYAGQQQLIKGSKEAIVIAVGEAGTKLFSPVYKGLYRMYSAIANLMNAMPMEARKAIVGFISAFGVLIGSAGAVLAFGAAMKFLGISVGGVALAFIKLGLFMAPAMLLLTGVVTIVASVTKAFEANSLGIGDSFRVMSFKVTQFAGAMKDFWTKGFVDDKRIKRIKDAGHGDIIPMFDRIGGVVKVIRKFWDGLVAGWLEGVRQLAPKIDLLRDSFGGILDRFLSDGDKPNGDMDKWKVAGKGAGIAIGKLGGIFIDWLNASAPLAEEMLISLKGMSAKELKDGIVGVVDIFKGLLDVLNRIGAVLKMIWGFFVTIPGNFIGEAAGGLYDLNRAIDGDISFAEFWERGKTQYQGTEAAIGNFDNNYAIAATGADPRTAKRRKSTSSIEELLSQYHNIKDWMTPGYQGEEGKKSFQDASRSMQEEYLLKLNAIAEKIFAMTGRPLVAKITIDEVGQSVEKYYDDVSDRELYEGPTSDSSSDRTFF